MSLESIMVRVHIALRDPVAAVAEIDLLRTYERTRKSEIARGAAPSYGRETKDARAVVQTVQGARQFEKAILS